MDVKAILKDITAYDNNVYQNKAIEDGTEKSSLKNDNTRKDDDPNSKENNKIDKKTDKKEIDKAINTLNKFLEPEKTHAEYSMHKELGTIMIKIIDDNSKKVILEVPSEKILNMVASMCEKSGLIDKKA